MSRKWRNWYQNEVDEEIKRANSRDKVKHNERSNQMWPIATDVARRVFLSVCMSVCWAHG